MDQPGFDQLRIDTPEQIALELPLAGIGSRFLAIAIDTLIQAAVYLITALVFIIAIPIGSTGLNFLPRLVGPAMAVFILFAVYWGYFAFFEIMVATDELPMPAEMFLRSMVNTMWNGIRPKKSGSAKESLR